MMSNKKNYQFTLVLQGVDDNTPGLEDMLYEAGCDDAMINFRDSTVYLDFDRFAETLEEAVVSAIKAVEATDLGVKVISVSPEPLVSIGDIAKRLSANRQTISLWVKGNRLSAIPFPNPILKVDDKSPLWRWSDVVRWLMQNHKGMDEEALADATFFASINAALNERDPELRRECHRLSALID